MNFSKWNKRITAWVLLLVGFYMGLMQFPIEYIALFLGSGLAAIGLAVWGTKNPMMKDPDNNDPKEEEETPG